jgi:cytochrome subunit of sulfide dehydrogenase
MTRTLLAAIVTIVAASTACAAEAPAGASSCSGCHAASDKAGNLIPGLRGRDPAELVAEMRAFRSGERPATIMDRIAKGYSEAEIEAIAAWFAGQP